MPQLTTFPTLDVLAMACNPVHRPRQKPTGRHKASGEALASFIRDHCHPVTGSLIPFGEFYERFVGWLAPNERPAWSKARVSKCLPAGHPSGAFTGNKCFVANLAWERATPGKPFLRVGRMLRREVGAVNQRSKW